MYSGVLDTGKGREHSHEAEMISVRTHSFARGDFLERSLRIPAAAYNASLLEG